jgi:hypothetical protein
MGNKPWLLGEPFFIERKEQTREPMVRGLRGVLFR